MLHLLELAGLVYICLVSGIEGRNGEVVCENRGYGPARCRSIGCCQWDDGQCWSAVGRRQCRGGDGGFGGDGDYGGHGGYDGDGEYGGDGGFGRDGDYGGDGGYDGEYGGDGGFGEDGDYGGDGGYDGGGEYGGDGGFGEDGGYGGVGGWGGGGHQGGFSSGGGNGEQVCEGHNYGKDKCESIGCCQYDRGQCWSAVGTATCVQTGGSGGPLDGPTGPTVPGHKCNVKVTFPKKTSPVSKYPLFTTVFGIPLMGSGISDKKFQHIASQLALWIDNDQDGCPDTPEVVTWLVKQKVVQWFGPGSDTANNRPDGDAIEKAGYKVGSALLFDQEINPSCSGTAQTSHCSDASIEEIWHVVTADGYAKAFPKVFSSSASSNSNLTKAMDVARGGRFTSVPSAYPSSAWYTYYDKTCGYDCQAVEYIYWAVASYVGALDKRTDVIAEWKYNTKAKLIAGDKLVTALIQDKTKYRLPTSAPNGDYRGCSTCSTGVNHGGN